MIFYDVVLDVSGKGKGRVVAVVAAEPDDTVDFGNGMLTQQDIRNLLKNEKDNLSAEAIDDLRDALAVMKEVRDLGSEAELVKITSVEKFIAKYSAGEEAPDELGDEDEFDSDELASLDELDDPDSDQLDFVDSDDLDYVNPDEELDKLDEPDDLDVLNVNPDNDPEEDDYFRNDGQELNFDLQLRLGFLLF